MIIRTQGSEEFVIELDREQLRLLNNALNEVCNGNAIEDWEFSTRLGASREAAERLLEELNRALP